MMALNGLGQPTPALNGLGRIPLNDLDAITQMIERISGCSAWRAYESESVCGLVFSSLRHFRVRGVSSL